MRTIYHKKNRAIRNLRKLTQSDLAKKIHITPQAYAEIEAGNTRLDAERLYDISLALDVSVDYIIKFDTTCTEQTLPPIQEDSPSTVTRLLDLLERVIEVNVETIKDLKTEIINLKNQIKPKI